MGASDSRRGIESLRKRLDRVQELLARAETELGERRRELTALHRVARLLHDETKPRAALMRQVASAVRSGMRYPQAAGARVVLGRQRWATRDFSPGRRRLRAEFRTADGLRGAVEVVYRKSPPTAGEPFSPEETGLLESVAELLAARLDREAAHGSLREAHGRLAKRVDDRTAELEKANEALRAEITERERAEAEREHLLKRQERYAGLLRRAGDRLEKRVARRTAELAQANVALGGEVEERRQAEEALRLTNELLERMFSSTHILTAYMDRDCNFIRVNRAYAQADGREPEFFVGKNHFDLYPHEENERIFRRVVATGEPFFVHAKPFVYPEHPERGVTYWDWSLEPVLDTQGSVTGIVLILLDVTQHRRAEEQLEAERRRLFSVLNMLPGFVLLHGVGTPVRFANHRFLDLFGAPGARPCYAVMRGRREPCRVCRAKEVLATGEPREWVWTSVRGRDYHVWGYPFSDTDGTMLVLTLGIDVTERRELEREILQVSDEEQRRIGRDLHDVLGQNLAGIAFLSKVRAQRLAAAGSPEADQAAEISALVSQTVAQTRAISRGLSPVDLSEEGLRNALRELAAGVEKVFGISCVFECTLPTLVFDRAAGTHLYRITQEAVSNATKHAQPRHVWITLADGEHGPVLSVRDDGVGLPDDASARGGMGLRIMQYRADIIGASLEMRRVPEGGTEVVCVVSRERAVGR